jgi:hypothetical protein
MIAQRTFNISAGIRFETKTLWSMGFDIILKVEIFLIG